MSEHPINGVLETTMQKIKEMVDVNTIIGDSITTPGGITLIPISKVSFGFASGGSDLTKKNETDLPFAGGAGAGVSIVPIAFMVINGNDIRLLHISENANTVDKVIEGLPDLITKTKEAFTKD